MESHSTQSTASSLDARAASCRAACSCCCASAVTACATHAASSAQRSGAAGQRGSEESAAEKDRIRFPSTFAHPLGLSPPRDSLRQNVTARFSCLKQGRSKTASAIVSLRLAKPPQCYPEPPMAKETPVRPR